AHTIGHTRCITFWDRIYNETSSIEGSFARTRQADCPRTIGSEDNNLVPLDLQSPTQFDNNYYQNLVQNRGLLHVDQQLFSGGSSDTIVTNYSISSEAFKPDFTTAMIKMGGISPLTGSK
ncbi:peroxidase 4-like, partial [Fagus crenata]